MVAVKAIIQKDGKVLALKRSTRVGVVPGTWDIPGGRIDFGETPIDAIAREIMEETGLSVKIGTPWSTWTFMIDNSDVQVVGVTMLAEYIGGEIKLSDEHLEYRWIDPSEFEHLPTDKSLKAKIADFGKK
ncbi:MAG: NUDIX domain-containing protein [Alphaproteobacteria bacterium]|nr:NUDIX domain-containing protein [Alphaproteobacteria bacterium]